MRVIQPSCVVRDMKYTTPRQKIVIGGQSFGKEAYLCAMMVEAFEENVRPNARKNANMLR